MKHKILDAALSKSEFAETTVSGGLLFTAGTLNSDINARFVTTSGQHLINTFPQPYHVSVNEDISVGQHIWNFFQSPSTYIWYCIAVSQSQFVQDGSDSLMIFKNNVVANHFINNRCLKNHYSWQAVHYFSTCYHILSTSNALPLWKQAYTAYYA